jgi:trigger factor
MPIFIRKEEREDEFPYKGFSQQLIGMNIGESREFSHKFPKNYKEEELRGQSMRYEVNIKMVRGSILPELNDDFAKQVGSFENFQALQDAIKANLESQSKAEYDDRYFSELVDDIKVKSIIKYPPQVLDEEIKHVMEDLKSRLAQQNMDLNAYLKTREMDEEKFISEEAKPTAIKRLERTLLMEELSKAENIEVSRELLQSSFQQTFGEVQGDPGFKKSLRGKAQPPKQLLNAIAMESASRAYVQQTLNRLREIAEGKLEDSPSLVIKKETEEKSKTSGRSKLGTTKKVAGSADDGKKDAKTPSSIKKTAGK